MTPSLDPVARAVLALVEKGQGRWGWHEFEVRLGAIDLPRRDYDVLQVLKALEEQGLVEKTSVQPSRWQIRPAGIDVLRGRFAVTATTAPTDGQPRVSPTAAPPAFSPADLAILRDALRGSPVDFVQRFGRLLADPERLATELRALLAAQPDAADAVAFGVRFVSGPARSSLARELWSSPRAELRRALFEAFRPARLEQQGEETPPALPPDDWRAMLRAGLDDPEPTIRRDAASLVFASASAAEVSASLVRNYARDPDSRWTILLALGSATDEASLTLLREAAASPDGHAAGAAVRALAARSDGLADALAASSSSVSDVRHAALFALANIAGPLNDIQKAALERAATQGAGDPELARALDEHRARHTPQRLPARSIAEEHLYLELHPHACGQKGAAGLTHELRFEGEARLSRFVGPCPRCGRPRDVWFVLPPDEPTGGAFGGPAPSQLLDAGEFLAASDAWAKSVDADPNSLSAKERASGRALLERALHALEEVLKFLPPGAIEVPASELRSVSAQAILMNEPGRFRRLRLEARRDAYRELLRAYSHEPGEPS